MKKLTLQELQQNTLTEWALNECLENWSKKNLSVNMAKIDTIKEKVIAKNEKINFNYLTSKNEIENKFSIPILTIEKEDNKIFLNTGVKAQGRVIKYDLSRVTDIQIKTLI